MPVRFSSAPFISSISSHFRPFAVRLLPDLQLQLIPTPKTPFFSTRPLHAIFCSPIAFQVPSIPTSSLLLLLNPMQNRTLQLHAQGGDPVVGGASEKKDSILAGTGDNKSGGSSTALEVSDRKDVNLEAGRNRGDAHSNSSDLSGGRAARIREKLGRELRPLELEVEDVSYQHAGHAAVRGNNNGETHFNVRIVSKEFEGKSLIKRHRLVYDLLQEELQSGLHALSIVAKTPSEVGAR